MKRSSSVLNTVVKVRKRKRIIPPYTIDKTWVSPSRLRNYLLRDPLLDWLEWNNKHLSSNSPFKTTVNKAVKDKEEPLSFTNFVMEQGVNFETNIVSLLKKKLKSNLKSLNGEEDATSPEKFKEVVESMRKGIPVLHSAVLHDTDDKIYGIADLLVRSDWINKLFHHNPLTKEEEKIKAPLLNSNYHYLVVDIKFATLNLRSDGKHLLNSGSIPAYKGQVYLYNQIVSKIQGYNPEKAFLLGRRWKSNKKGEAFSGDSAFSKLGTVDFKGVDKIYTESVRKAISWIRDVREEASKDWNVSSTPLTREELYPNMCNTHDFPWRGVKEQMAEDIGELTKLWMVGTKNRETGHSNGIWRWDDPNCTPESLGINGEFTSSILEKIIHINKQSTKEIILPDKISSNMGNWKEKRLEFYVDFESVNDVMTDMKKLPKEDSLSMIFMIGVGYWKGGDWIYKSFITDSLSEKEEGRICKEFSLYVKEICKEMKVSKANMIHWSDAEPKLWDKAVARHYPRSYSWVEGNPNTRGSKWFDLLSLFKEEPIVVKGCFNFGLKSVAKTMYKHEMIKTTWGTSEGDCLDGQGAMVGAWKCHGESLKTGKRMGEMDTMIKIRDYNEVDVKTLGEIISYLRDNLV